MKILVIPDVHQSTVWKEVFTSGKFKDYDRIVQVGDWFDAWKNNWRDNAPIKNLNDAIDLSISIGNFDVLLGNHDMSYLGYTHCSGFQAHKLQDIRKALQDAEPYMNICVEHDGWVFSHAGVSQEWANNNINNISRNPILDINNLYHRNFVTWFKLNEQFKENCNSYNTAMMSIVTRKIEYDKSIDKGEKYGFSWSDRDEAQLEYIKQLFGSEDLTYIKNFIVGAHAFDFNGFNCYGDDTWQTPLWIRPNSLATEGNMFFQYQCVGHTEMEGEMPKVIDVGKCRLVIVDNEKHNCFTEIDTETNSASLAKIN